MILFKEIYDKAINLFDDPDIQRDYFFDKIKGQRKMKRFLDNGIQLFTNPTNVTFLLTDVTEAEGKLETFIGTGDNIITLSTTPKEGSEFRYTIAGKPTYKAIYDGTHNQVIFDDPIPQGTQASVEWYYAGKFNTDFSSAATPRVPAKVICDRVKEILARALVLAWAENEKNFVLDIKNVLTDTDFKLYSPANSIKAKTEWVKQLKAEFDNMQTKLCWDVWSRKYHGGKYYG